MTTITTEQINVDINKLKLIFRGKAEKNVLAAEVKKINDRMDLWTNPFMSEICYPNEYDVMSGRFDKEIDTETLKLAEAWRKSKNKIIR